MEKKYCYEYPRPAVTVDIVCLRSGKEGEEILLIRRKHEPFQGLWALPGGFVNSNEDPASAACRELKEETGLIIEEPEQFHCFGRPGRDPRGWTISIAFLCRIGHKGDRPSCLIHADDDASDVRWFSARKLPTLAFDHDEIIARALMTAGR